MNNYSWMDNQINKGVIDRLHKTLLKIKQPKSFICSIISPLILADETWTT